jgi:hypothetical protein
MAGHLRAAMDGGEAQAWTRLGTSARTVAMGRAEAGLLTEADAIEGNVSGLAALNQGIFSSQTALLPAERQLDHLSYANQMQAFEHFFGAGISVTRFAFNAPIEKRDTNTPDPVAEWWAQSWSFGLGLASAIPLPGPGKLLAGLGLRTIFEQWGDASSNGYGVDIGALYRFNYGLDLGLVLKDLNNQSTLGSGTAESAPLSLRLGLAERWAERITASMEIEKNADQDPRIRSGLELYFLSGRLALRIGLNAYNWAAGFGVRQQLLSWPCRLDYAVQQDPTIPGVLAHRFSLGIEFPASNGGPS